MPDARSEFDRHLTMVQEYAGLNLSESDPRAYLVDPLLRLLGFADVKHLRREVTVPATKEFLDYELLVDGQPEVIVEAKAVRHSLSDRHAAQCVQYASVLGVRWCLITNGLAWALGQTPGCLFQTSRGPRRRLHLFALTTLFDRLGARAAVVDCHPHRFRHTFATWALEQRAREVDVQHLLGHATGHMLQRYAATYDAARAADAHADFSPARRLAGVALP